jgi:glycosyltransferase involved in cell wall biosynthesis
VQHRLRVAIDARLVPGTGHGGTESVLMGLVQALGELDGPEQYALLVDARAPDWLDSVRAPNQKVVIDPGTDPKPQSRRSLRSWSRTQVGRVRSRLLPRASHPAWPEPPISDGFIESVGCDLIHFPTQRFTVCALPFIYNPHDLQHRHYPEFFSAQELAWREVTYRMACRLAQTVAVGSTWIADDVEREFGIHRSRIQVIPWAAPTQAVSTPSDEQARATLKRFALSDPYALYPAMIWRHKNHIRLLEALALLRDRDHIELKLVCTGFKHEQWWPRVEQRRHELGLQGQVSFLGNVSGAELRAIYRAASFVVVPTLFEAASAPMFEGWFEGVPVTCSNITSLPEQAGDAALLFDPLSVEQIAEALRRMHQDGSYREQLRARGTARLADFDWKRTARAYRALYRRVGLQRLSDEDARLLRWNWMRDRAPDDSRIE